MSSLISGLLVLGQSPLQLNYHQTLYNSSYTFDESTRVLSIMTKSPLFPIFTFCLTLLVAWGQRSYCAKTLEEKEDAEKKTKYIIDVDAGVDDAIAILYFLGVEKLMENVRVIGITCANGNTDVDNVVMNVLKTLKVVNRLDVPVYKGCASPILKESERDYYFGKDGFGDFFYPDPPSRNIVKKKHAVNALISLVKNQPGEISLICLAPLTNIAMAVNMYPSFFSYVKDIYILGGAVEGYGLMRPGIEFNFFMDPEAVFIVLKSAEEFGKKITLVPSETFFAKNIISMDWRVNTLGAVKSPAMELIVKAENKSLSGDLWLCGDPLLAAIALNNSLIITQSMHPVTIETCGTMSRGAIFVDYLNKSKASAVKIVNRIDIETYKALLLTYLR